MSNEEERYSKNTFKGDSDLEIDQWFEEGPDQEVGRRKKPTMPY